jgi:hypothetical protein
MMRKKTDPWEMFRVPSLEELERLRYEVIAGLDLEEKLRRVMR